MDILCKCGKNLTSEEFHICPFKSDVWNDDSFMCNCCDECRQECSDDT